MATDNAELSRVYSVNSQTGRPQPSERLHPDNVDFAAHDNNAVLKQVHDALNGVFVGIGNVDDLRATPHPEDKPAVHARKVKSAVSDLERSADATLDNATHAVGAELKRVEAELEGLAGLKPDPRFEAAIVARYAGMKPQDQQAAISTMIADGDMRSLATILEAPGFVTGLDADTRAAIRLRVYTTVAPKTLALRDALRKAQGTLTVAVPAAADAFLRLRGGTERFADASKAAEAVAARASGFQAA